MNKLKAAAGNTNAHAAEGKQPTTTDISRRGEIVHYPGPSMSSTPSTRQWEAYNRTMHIVDARSTQDFVTFVFLNQTSQLE